MRAAVLVFMAVLAALPVCAQEGVFLREEQAPAAVFPGADHFARVEVESTPELRERMSAGLDGVHPSLWEERYVVFTARRGTTPLMWFRDGRVSHATH